MKNFKLLCSILLLVILSSCIEEDEISDSKYRTISLKSSVSNTDVPSQLWDKLEETFFEKATNDEYSEGMDYKTSKIAIPKKVMDITMLLTEKTTLSLGGYNYRLEFGSSGNRIDLKDYINNDKSGTFYLKFILNPEPIGQKFRVFHVSNSKVLKLNSKTLNSGCMQYRDITDYFKKMNNDKGFLISSAQARHIALLGGTFVFVTVQDNVLYFAHIDVTDSRYPDYFCRK
ncbi:MAG: hypothetical protein AB8E15_06905 [Bdellovibrionales bacterium]